MTNENILDAIGMINEEVVREAKAYKRPKSRNWVKWGAVAACLCLVAVGTLGGVNFHMKQYAISNNISVDSTAEYNDSISFADVTPEQADRLTIANNTHNTLSAQNYEWYGSCYYDFETDRIMVGLTEASDSNKETVLTHMGDTAAQFYECDYSYQYLKELYSKLDENRTMLSLLGVDRFNISIEKNRVNVHITSAEKYGAIYTVNEMDSLGGAVVFTSDTVTADRS